ncbi:hypothetical protein ACQRUO_21975, partial [Kitasatospora sp. LaBMicrA B282]
GRADRGTGPGRTRPRRRRGGLLAAAVACLAVLGTGTGVLLSNLGSGSANPTAAAQQNLPNSGQNAGAAANPTPAPGGAPNGSPSGPAFTAAGLPDQIRALLGGPASGHEMQPHVGADGTAPGGLPACVESAVTGHQGEQPLLVGHGSFESAPVDVYVFRIAGDPAHDEVYLLAAGCATHSPDTPARVLLQQEVPAP